MKNEIQKLITELEARKKSHRSDFIIAETPLKGEVAIALEDECDFFIDKLKLLLNDESKQPQPPDFANTMLGEVPPVVKLANDTTCKAAGAVEPGVRYQ